MVGAALYDARRALDLSSTELDAFVTPLGNAVLFIVLMHSKQMSFRELAHPSRNSMLSTAVFTVPASILLVPLLLLVVAAAQDFLLTLLPLSRWEEQAFERMSSGSLAAIVTVCVLAPVLEEMLFRGIILRAFLLQYSRWASIFGSALIFGVAHLNIYQFLVALLLGTVAGWLYERTRSLIPCIALHGAYNATVTVLEATPSEASVGHWAMATMAASVGAVSLVKVLRYPEATDPSAP